MLQETDYSENDLYDELELDDDYDEPFVHKCNEQLGNILDIFFKHDQSDEISFEHDLLEKL